MAVMEEVKAREIKVGDVIVHAGHFALVERVDPYTHRDGALYVVIEKNVVHKIYFAPLTKFLRVGNVREIDTRKLPDAIIHELPGAAI